MIDTIFHQCIREELEVLVRALEALDPNKLDESHRDYREMCLNSCKAELHERYTQWEKTNE